MSHYALVRTALLICCLAGHLPGEEAQPPALPHGNHQEKGTFAEINGIKIYYEIHGEGEPLVLIHSNSGNIATMAPQIEHFSKSYQVIAVDSRGHGKSGLGEGELTYLQMADDYAKLLGHLKVNPAHVIGCSDGGIIGLLLGIHHPETVNKIAAMGANLNPGPEAVYDWAPQFVRTLLKVADAKIEENDESHDWNRMKKVMSLLVEQPNITLEELQSIKSPVIVLSGDRDIIREEHTILIYQNIPNAHLCIFPGATHFMASRNPKKFNATVEHFLQTPFTRPDSRKLLLRGK